MSVTTELRKVLDPGGVRSLAYGKRNSAEFTGGLQLDADEVGRFQKDGFISLESITSSADVKRIRAMIEALHRKKAGFSEGAGFNLVQGFPIILNPHYYDGELLKTEFFKNALAVARQLLGPKARFANDETLMKPGPNGPATPWHQDAAFRDPRYEFREISIWLPLQPVDQTNGCMEYVPGTQLGEVLPHRVPPAEPNSHALECYDGFDPASAVPCPLPVGGCAIHSGKTLHHAGPNNSSQPRHAYVLLFDIAASELPEPQKFPWLDNQDLPRLSQKREWLRSGGMAVHLMRKLRRLNWRDPVRLAFDAKRAATALFRPMMSR
jgi:hypothetical protein